MTQKNYASFRPLSFDCFAQSLTDIADPSSKLVTFSVAGVASNDPKISFICCVRTGLGVAAFSISALALALAMSLPTLIAFNPISMQPLCFLREPFYPALSGLL